jgi:RND family efflux transporter MFP subunit
MNLSVLSHRLFLTISFALLTLFTSSAFAKQNMVVDVVKAQHSNNGQLLALSGTLTAEKRSLLSPRVDGLISEVDVDAGSKVSQGDVLLVLDSVMTQHELTQIKANVGRAEADLNEARRLVTEAERLISSKHIPQNELAIRKANLQLKQAELSAIKASQANVEETIRRHRLIAPFSGVISTKYSEAGEWVSRGDAVLELVNLDRVRLDVNVPQERFADITKNTHVVVSSGAYPNQKLAASIQAIVPVSNAQVRAFLVRITLENSEFSLLPGTSAIAEFDINSASSEHVLIPRDALLINPDGSYNVFIVKDGKAYRKKVDIGRVTPQGVNVSRGLTADDLVVIRGNEVLSDQQTVTVNKVSN